MHTLVPTIIFDDEHMIVVNKPAGLVVHSDGRTEEATLTEWVIGQYPHLSAIGGLHTLDSERYVPRAGILHRLDRDTSGVILIAKDDETFFFLQRQFLDHSIEKIYHAIVSGVLDEPQGEITDAIGRSRADFRQWAVAPHARGTLRKAETSYRVLAVHGEDSFMHLAPHTGRTHQLRVHMASLGHPILRDTRYGGRMSETYGFARLALHAERITLTYGGARRTFVAPYPSDFERAAQIFGL
jgi:23S rRNA pseudouridine1911/1915/1917 synthase